MKLRPTEWERIFANISQMKTVNIQTIRTPRTPLQFN